jgi:hypothetical protein
MQRGAFKINTLFQKCWQLKTKSIQKKQGNGAPEI